MEEVMGAIRQSGRLMPKDQGLREADVADSNNQRKTAVDKTLTPVTNRGTLS